MSSTLCISCGRPLEFRHIDGRAVPIGCACSRGGSRPLFDGSFGGGNIYSSWTFESRCYESWDTRGLRRPSPCEYCGEPVYFIRHNGGSVWLSKLGWPWPKHPCYYKARSRGRGSFWQECSKYFSRRLTRRSETPDVLLGVVVRRVTWGDASRRYQMIGIQFENWKGACYSITSTVRVLCGAIVFLFSPKAERELYLSDGSRIEVLRFDLPPDLLDLPLSFLKDPRVF